jgi:hypothetical protein
LEHDHVAVLEALGSHRQHGCACLFTCRFPTGLYLKLRLIATACPIHLNRDEAFATYLHRRCGHKSNGAAHRPGTIDWHELIGLPGSD